VPGPIGVHEHTTASLLKSQSPPALQELVAAVLGPQTFGLGVIYGAGENVAGGIVSIAAIAKTLLLADLYDRANQPTLLNMNPFAASQQAAASVSMWQFRRELEEARAERDALLAELGYAVTHPVEVFGDIGATYADKWRRFEASSAERTLTGQFEAGRIVGDVLVDVLSVIGTGVAVGKTAAKIPRLVRLAQRRGLAVRASGASAATGEPAVTPSQFTGRGRVVEPELPPPEAKLKGKPVPLQGMSWRTIQYTKRTAAEREALRKEFYPGVRKQFLKDLANDPEKAATLRKAGITEQEIADMRNGIAPDLYDVHHKLPLDDNGTNAADNLILMKNDPYHRALTNMQNELTKGMVPGETRTLSWPVPDGFVYPAQ
jgi:hypothetical protein